ncbi:unnamed protein product [Orchesella dallaii]|uniref:Uncharacterized protein n=1 Tax=Orchesella dallaii TaxID=48710 RepID=A0ABP1S2I3_9HEXA
MKVISSATAAILVIIVISAVLILPTGGSTYSIESKVKRQGSNPQKEALRYLLDHISEYQTEEEFRRFLQSAPKSLHPSLTDMWMHNRQNTRSDDYGKMKRGRRSAELTLA